jgi:flagellin
MSLGVLNNLSAMYAENSLNNTNNSLQTVLQQLSSGSRINSGADDAAGLSLVNGLQANATALAQSQTNATEGVNLLTVADGALSQVTSLLNRAVTLATEASNGTLNGSQDLAANQEYQSILSEINNIGATTTYNQERVFGSNTSIYTGDSSTQGASINQLNIRSLSSSNVGDTNGLMAYSNGTNNVFVDLSTSGKNAAVTDTLGSTTQTTTISVSYLTSGANGAAVQASASISVGAGTNYANTAQGLISAINNAGLGVTATFGTAADAGTAATATAIAANDTNNALLTSGTDTGIIISGAGVGVNNSTSAAGYNNGAGVVGALTVSGSADTLGGTLNIVGTDGVSHSIILGTANSTDTLANLASTINAAGYGVTAAVNTSAATNAAGTFATGTLLTLTSSDSQVSISGSNITDAQSPTAITLGAASVAGGAAGAVGYVPGTITVNNSTDTVTGILNVTPAAAATTPAAVNLNLGGQTLAQIEANFNGSGSFNWSTYGLTASLNAAGTTLTLTENVANGGSGQDPVLATATGSLLQDHAAATGTNPLIVNQTAVFTAATTAGTALGTVSVTNANDALTSGTLKITDYTGATNTVNLGTAGSTDNLNDLAYYINHTMDGGSATSFLAAAVNSAGTQLTITNTHAAAAGVANDMMYGTGVTSTLSLTDTPTASGTASATTLGVVALTPGSSASTALAGALALGTETITLGTAATTSTPGTATLSELAQTINTGNYGVSATLNTAGTAMTLTSPDSANINITPTPSAAATMISFSTPNQGEISSSYYSIGISGSVEDTSTGANTTTALTKGLSADGNGSTGVATISYSDAAGASLAATDLSNSTDAQSALTALNSAISDLAAQDGYLGAQINTLNAVSSVTSTQQQNVIGAQNAVQATDYAMASSNLSKYEILSQTGIAALAQANSLQQEVIKLLQ